ncbi:MAG: hypothetical protein PHR77_19315, partial [Kiritimatiellae bacterium]|nr:hypothetical protein [Kiritimatiellia bacterium]
DEVHMLSTAAFNALLKTLEEPPPHVKFIFATTEPEKILPTILSRCQRFDLRRISVSLIVERLKLIASKEKIKVEPDALLAIARGCEGGLRDAVSALDQLVSFKGMEIKEEDVLSVFGLASRSLLENVVDKILQGDVKSVIESIASLDESGKDMQRFVIELMDHFRNLLVWMHVNDASSLELMESQIATLKKQAALTNSERVLRIADILGEAENRMKYALSKRTLLEMALIRCVRAATVVSIEDILKHINMLRTGIDGNEDTGTRRRGDAGIPKEKDGNPAVAETRISKTETEGPEKEIAVQESAVSVGNEVELLTENWREIVDKVGKMAIGTKSLLLDARPLTVDGVKVTIGFDPEFADEIKSFATTRNRQAVEHVLGMILKRKVNATFIVSDQVAKKNMEGISPVLKHKPAGSAPAKGQPKGKRDLIDDPTVQKALDVFDGTILDVRE